MPKYRVKSGRSHSGFKIVDGVRVRHEFGSGEVVELTENSAMAFADCFDLVEEPRGRSVEQPKEQVELTPAEKGALTRIKNKALKDEAAKAAESGG